jgi:predicted MFS family arabinose efflux permease
MQETRAFSRFAWPYVGLWRHADFLKFWAAQAISALGSRITRTALPILAVLTIDASADQVALLAALSLAPGVLVGLVLSGRIDRRAKRPLLVGADLIRALLLLTVPLSAWLGHLNMGQLYAVAALTGAATTLFQIADNAYLPALIGKDRLMEGNSKLETTEAIAEMTGPGLGGLLVQAITAPVAIIFDALSFLASAILLSAIRREEVITTTEDHRPTLIHDLRVGLGASLFHPLVRPVLLVEAGSAICHGFFAGLYMIYGLKTLQISPGTLGLVISAGGVGALFGAILAGRLSNRLGFGLALIVCMAGSRIAALLIPLARGPQWLAVSFLLGHQLLGDALLMGYHVLAVSLRQTVLPQATLARSNAAFHVATGVLLPLGALVAGPVAEATDVRTALWISAILGLINPWILQFSPVRRLKQLPPGELGGILQAEGANNGDGGCV